MIDTDVLYSPGFWILSIGAIAATIIGYVMSVKAGMPAFSIPTLAIIMVTEIIASYYFASR